MLKFALAKLLTIKAAAIATIAVSGGVALAATTGALPNPFGAAPGKPAASQSAKPQHSNAPKGSPAPNLDGLCKAYAAKPDGERGKALESPAFQALIGAAGGQENVADFCATRLPSPKPSKPATGKPSTVPNGAPSVKPTGHPVKPSTAPSHP